MPPISSLLPSSTQSSTSVPLPILPLDALATSGRLQQISAVRQVTSDLQQRKPRHPKRPSLPQVKLVRPQNQLLSDEAIEPDECYQ